MTMCGVLFFYGSAARQDPFTSWCPMIDLLLQEKVLRTNSRCQNTNAQEVWRSKARVLCGDSAQDRAQDRTPS